MALELFAVTAPGLEPVAAAELAALGLRGEVVPGGVAFAGDAGDLCRASLALRSAGRLLVRMGDFRATSFAELVRRARALPWERFVPDGAGLALRVTCRRSRLWHSGAVAERVVLAASERLGRALPLVRAAAEDAGSAPEGQLVVVRLERDRCTVSADASGAPLHRRGYRAATAKAPLRETLAAGLLLALEWQGDTPLLDPFCGAGTLVLEAALLARRRAPGLGRSFAFERWPGFDAALATARREAEGRAAGAPAPPPLAGSDRDAGAVAAARANAERAGLAADVTFSCRPVSALEPPPGRGLVATNPPHGVRLGRGRDLRDLYGRLGSVLRRRCPGWQVGLLAPPPLAAATGLPLSPRLRVVHGGLHLALFAGHVPERA